MKGVVAALGLISAASVLAAASIPVVIAQQQPVFRSGVDVVRLDVSALDRDFRPVRGLKTTDFSVREDGKPQEIVAFEEIDLPGSAAVPAGWLRDVSPDVRKNSIGDGRLIAIILDDATLPADPSMMRATRQAAEAVVAEMGPSDQVAVIFTRDGKASQDFTTDRGLLRAAINKVTPGFLFMGLQNTDDFYFHMSSIKTLSETIGYMASVADRRKAVVYVSIGVMLDSDAVARITAIGPDVETAGDDTQRDLQELVKEATTRAQQQQAYGQEMRDAFVSAQHASVTVYSVNPAALGALEAYLANRMSPMTGKLPGMTALMDQSRMRNDYLKTVSANTGGRAFTGMADMAGAIRNIFNETSQYYLIGYRSTRQPGDRRVKKVDVRVNRPGVSTRTRSAVYEAAAPAPKLRETAQARLTNALAGVVPKAEMELRAVALPFAGDGAKQPVAVMLGVHQVVPAAGDAPVDDTVDLDVRAFTNMGEPRGSTRRTANVRLRKGQTEGDFDVALRLELNPGRYQLRLAAHSKLTDRTGSVYYDLEVPDFRRLPISISGVAFAATPSTVIAPVDAFGSLMPVVPTTRRSFLATDVVTAFMRVYQGSGNSGRVIFTASLLAADNKAIWSESRILTGPDVLQPLPISTLAPGPYLARFVASSGGREVKRDVVIEIQK
jgi:VWFA-related protein